MKTSEIETGKIYLHNSVTDWRFSNWSTNRVRVVDAVPGYWTYSRIAKEWQKSNSGNGYSSKKGILVERLLDDSDKVIEREIVSVGHLRGDWDTCREQQKVAQAAAKERYDKEQARRAAVRQLVRDTAQMGMRLFGKGVQANNADTKIEVDPVLFRAMCMKLDQVGWKYE